MLRVSAKNKRRDASRLCKKQETRCFTSLQKTRDAMLRESAKNKRREASRLYKKTRDAMLRESAKNKRREASRLYKKNKRREASRLYKKQEGRAREILKRWIGATTRDCPFAVKYRFICASVLIICAKKNDDFTNTLFSKNGI